MANTNNNTEAKQIVTKHLEIFKVQCEEPPAYWVCVDTVERLLNAGRIESAYDEANTYAIQMSRAGY